MDRDRERPECCRCGAPASELEAGSLRCFCRRCALERAEALLPGLGAEEKLELARFAPLADGGGEG